jgi:hypothetical protein
MMYLHPMKNRKTMNWLMFVATAAAMVRIMNKKLQLWYSGSRPYISDNGAMTGKGQHVLLTSFIC